MPTDVNLSAENDDKLLALIHVMQQRWFAATPRFALLLSS